MTDKMTSEQAEEILAAMKRDGDSVVFIDTIEHYKQRIIELEQQLREAEARAVAAVRSAFEISERLTGCEEAIVEAEIEAHCPFCAALTEFAWPHAEDCIYARLKAERATEPRP